MHSLGGFRIAPKERTQHADYNNDREALGLGIGMEEKVFWSRLVRIAGPRTLPQLDRVVGGKCVLYPTEDARVGMPRDRELLDFAGAALNQFEASTGVKVTTGQDLGHGTMSDGKTHSLAYLHEQFAGSILSDTSHPTAEGNYWMLKGCLAGFGISLPAASIALIGAGNIGMHLIHRLQKDGARMIVLEANPARVTELREQGVEAYETTTRSAFLQRSFDALVVNANGGTLDTATVKLICQNIQVKVICGCENLTMPHPEDAELFRDAGKIYTPTEMCGMMGYLTAIEERLSNAAGVPFSLIPLLEAATKLQEVGLAGTRQTIASRFSQSFEQAVREVFSRSSGSLSVSLNCPSP